MRRHLILVNAVGLFFFLAAEAGGQETRIKGLKGQTLEHSNSSLCARGGHLSTACDSIRAREILDASATPFNAIGRVNHTGYRNRSHCAGTLVSGQVVLTAAHCLFNQRLKAWVSPEDVVFVAGYQRSDYVAAEKVIRYIVGVPRQPGIDTFNRKKGSDWALLVLEKPITDGVTAVPLADLPDAPRPTSVLYMAGYTGLRPHVLSQANDCGVPETKARPHTFALACATMRGDSGAPVFKQGRYGIEIVGIVSAVRDTDGDLQTLVIPSISI